MEDLFSSWIQTYRWWGEHGLVVMSAPLWCFVPVLHVSLSALQLIYISRLLSSPSSLLPERLWIRFGHPPCSWLHRDARTVLFWGRFVLALCSSWTELAVDLSSGSPMCQVFCFAVACLTLENLPPFRGVTPRDSWELCTFVIEETVHWSGNRRRFLNDALLRNI